MNIEKAIKLFLEENDELKVIARTEKDGVTKLMTYDTLDEKHETFEFFEVACGDIHVERNDKFIGAYYEREEK